MKMTFLKDMWQRKMFSLSLPSIQAICLGFILTVPGFFFLHVAHGQTIHQLELPRIDSNDLIIEHTGYTISYNKRYHVANWVAYELTAEETVSKVKRSDKFVPDPLLSQETVSNEDYLASGYDRGHLAPAADMNFSQMTMVESFYLSNMAPQLPGFNRGIWSKLEKQVRHWAVEDGAVYIVTGTILTPGLRTIGTTKVTVPNYFYKVILDYREPELKGIGFILPNESSSEPLQHFAVTIDSVEKVTGRDFFYQLPDEEETSIERSLNLTSWKWPVKKE